MKINVREIAIFGILGGFMYASKMIMEVLPNVHLLGVFVISITVVYRKKALYPIYTYVLLTGMFAGFSLWWIPHLYVWTILWGMTMLLPKNVSPILYILLCSLHGFLYGTLYAPAQALMFGFDFEQTISWIIAGLPWDVVHGISNIFCGILISPIISILRKSKQYAKQ